MHNKENEGSRGFLFFDVDTWYNLKTPKTPPLITLSKVIFGVLNNFRRISR